MSTHFKYAAEQWRLAFVIITSILYGCFYLDAHAATEKPGNIELVTGTHGFVLYRSGASFLPPVADFPGLVVGGVNEGVLSAIADAFWLDGRTQNLAPLNHERRNAQLFRLHDGSILVFGGIGANTVRRSKHIPLPLELLPSTPSLEKARWVDIEFDTKGILSLGMLNDGSLLAVYSSGKVERLSIVITPDKITVQRSTFPSLNRARIESNVRYSVGLVIREVAGGRIIVAGGSTQYQRMALMHDDVDKGDAADHFTYLGEFSPSHHYEIYDPKSRRWSESAISSTDSAASAILNDGRVVKWGSYSSRDPWNYADNVSPHSANDAALEISSSDGMTWGPLKEEAPPLVATNATPDDALPLVIQGELFLIGVRVNNSWRSDEMVQWYNSTQARWETLWEITPTDKGYRTNRGRIIIRDLPNGKRIALPVAVR